MVLDVTEINKSLPWEERKKEAIEHIKDFSHDSLMLKSADVISNVSEIIYDYDKEGDSVFKRFGAPEPKKENVINNYSNVMKAILSRWPENPMKDELNFLIDGLGEIRRGNKTKKELENYGLSEERLKGLEKARIEFEKETRELNELQKKNPQEMDDYYDEVFGK
jgi:hypothetical protein